MISNLKLLGVGSNSKTIKGDGEVKRGGVATEYLTAILYLSSADSVDGINLCKNAERAGCKWACLVSAGRGQMNNVQAARARKTVLLRDDPDMFYLLLRNDLARFAAYCTKRNIQPVVRLNGTSDWPFWKSGIMEKFPMVQFYDYTKNLKWAYKDLPSNYHITISYSEADPQYAINAVNVLRDGKANMAVVFRDKDRIPDYFWGIPVVDGDKDDLRFLDKKGVVVALYAKGRAKQDYSGFVVDL